ncbi:MAG: DUF1697 domain-containing protein [Chloroflexi bacterium]|nr:DUF1697 domain-containing protein [Chloroflexota bacterium]
MNSYISLLRGINVSGRKKIRMIELRSLYEAMNLVNPQTYLQSGNVVFDSEIQDRERLAEIIAAQIKLSFGYDVSVIVRTAVDLQRIIENNPFLQERNEDPTKLYVTFLQTAPSEPALSALQPPQNETGEYVMGEWEIFVFCPDGYGRTKLSNNFFERKLKIPATTRNWKTVNALCQMVEGREE